MAQIKRETAIICMIDDLLQGSFVRTEGWTPSYFSTSIGNISRANMMGVIVGKDPEGVFVDDGSGRIQMRSFEEKPSLEVNVGDFVLIIGRPRVYNEQKYILVEIIRRIDSKWGEYRKIQLANIKKNSQPQKTEKRIAAPINDNAVGANHYQKIIGFIKDLDSGDGADSGEVLKRVNAPNGEELLRRLIEEGEIFEIRAGKLKLLD